MPCYDVAHSHTSCVLLALFPQKKHITIYSMCLAGNIALILELLFLLGADVFQTLG
jgi:hypothetical protein